MEDYDTAIDIFEEKVKKSYTKDWKKGVKNFTKNLLKVTNRNLNTLKQSMFKLKL